MNQAQDSAQAAQDLVQRGVAASQGGDAELACQMFQQACEAAPTWALPPFLLGSEHAALSDFVRAEALFASAVLLDPLFHLARYQLGLLQFSGGRPQVALLTWAPLAQLPDDLPFPHLFQAFAALQADAFEEATRQFERALPLAADNDGLQSDIRKLLAGIAEKNASAGAPRAEFQETEPAAVEHVLVSNYGRSTLH